MNVRPARHDPNLRPSLGGLAAASTHDGGIPGYGSLNFTDSTGSRTATIVVSTELPSEFPVAFPKITEAHHALQTAALCTMFGKPAPDAAHTG
jgi:D-alanyl-D-alanine carboxypeptidase